MTFTGQTDCMDSCKTLPNLTNNVYYHSRTGHGWNFKKTIIIKCGKGKNVVDHPTPVVKPHREYEESTLIIFQSCLSHDYAFCSELREYSDVGKNYCKAGDM